MEIIEVNHKTVANLLKKSVEEYWLEDKDAWFRFTDGSTVCIHILEGHWDAYMCVDKFDGNGIVSFHDEQGIMAYWQTDGREELYTSRTVSVNFDNWRYYYHRNFKYVTRQYISVVEFHYYEKGEEIGNHS